jgi:dipicolinate synthase subunit B
LRLKGKKITFGITGSIHVIKQVVPQIQNLIKEGADIIPIMSFNYGEVKEEKEKIIKEICSITNKEINRKDSLIETDIMIIAPCSGNIIAKLANGIIDEPILVSAEIHMKSEKNIVIGIGTAEGLGLEAKNIGKLLNMKRIFFIPFRQNNPITKPNSLMYSNKYILETTVKALNGEQIQPILL